MPVPSDLVIPSRQLNEPCARCPHPAGQHHLGRVRSWEACRVHDCPCPGWCASVACATCDFGTPRWAGYSQCLACLDYHIKPCDYVYKHVVGFDAEAATTDIRAFREEWQVKHPGWELLLDRQRLFPDAARPSRHADRQTTIQRKLYYSRFLVVPAHPTLSMYAKHQRMLNRICAVGDHYRQYQLETVGLTYAASDGNP